MRARSSSWAKSKPSRSQKCIRSPSKGGARLQPLDDCGGRRPCQRGGGAGNDDVEVRGRRDAGGQGCLREGGEVADYAGPATSGGRGRSMSKQNTSALPWTSTALWTQAGLLPIRKGPVRFAVGPSDGLTSNSWKVWANKKGDVYIACWDHIQRGGGMRIPDRSAEAP